VTALQAALLFGAGIVAGIVNTVAGGGSLLTVPLLNEVAGLPGNLANGTNRIGVLVQSGTAALRFRAEGVPGGRGALPLLVPTALGAGLGAYGIAWVSDHAFERLFGLLMLALVGPTVWGIGLHRFASLRVRSPRLRCLVFLAVGLYGGAVQAGVGLLLIAALAAAGFDLVRANSVKVVLNGALTLVACAIFLLQDLVRWPAALVLGAGFGIGGILGARLSVRGGERFLRPAILCAVILLAGRMLGLY